VDQGRVTGQSRELDSIAKHSNPFLVPIFVPSSHILQLELRRRLRYVVSFRDLWGAESPWQEFASYSSNLRDQLCPLFQHTTSGMSKEKHGVVPNPNEHNNKERSVNVDSKA
jgi:hypothetical protein